MGSYINAGFNIYHGKGYTAMDGSDILTRGPVFPFLIAVSYSLLGVSPWSAFWVVRIFCILNPIMIYVIGTKVYGRIVGFGAALLVLTSYSVNFWSYRHLDAIWPFFLFVSIIFILTYIETSQLRYLVISAVSMGICYLTKEVAILFFPLPLLSLWSKNSCNFKSYIIANTIFYMCVLIILIPWFVHGGGLIGKFGPIVLDQYYSNNSFVVNILYKIKKFAEGLVKFYNGHKNSIDDHFVGAWILLPALMFVVIDCIRSKDAKKVAFVVSICLFLPILQTVGNINLRFGQVSFFYYALYLVLSAFLYYGCDRVSIFLDVKNKAKFSTISYVICIFVFVVVQLVVPSKRFPSGIQFLKNSFMASPDKIFDEGVIKGVLSKRNKKITSLLLKIIPSGSRIMVSDKAFSRDGGGLYFFSDGKYKIYRMPFMISRIEQNENLLWKFPRDKNFIILDAKKKMDSANNYVSVLKEDVLYKYIKTHNIEYVVLFKHRRMLRDYFRSNPSFKQISGDISSGVKVYRIEDDLIRHSYSAMVTKKAKSFLQELHISAPERFKLLVETYFKPVLNMDAVDVTELISGR